MIGLNAFLQYALALLFFFFLYAQAVTWVLELVAQNGNWRGRFLRGNLKQWLGRGRSLNWLERIMNHPAVHGLSQSSNRSTEYIPPVAFADAVMDILADEATEYRVQQDAASGEYQVQEPQAVHSMAMLDAGLASVEASDFKDLLMAVRRRAGEDKEAFHAGLQTHFDAFGKRVSTWYKKKLRWPLFWIGLVIAVGLNVDTLFLADALWKDPIFAAQMAEAAKQTTSLYQDPGKIPPESVTEYLRQYEELMGTQMELPFGWGVLKKYWKAKQPKAPALKPINDQVQTFSQSSIDVPPIVPPLPKPPSIGLGFGPWDWAARIFGWLLSAWIASVGAPFWYELLKKLTNYGRKPEAIQPSRAS